MPKVVNDLNQIWVEQDNELVKIGFTRNFLDTLDQCWHILPANNKKFKSKMPLMTVETNDGLVSILSPVDGFLQEFAHKAQDFPDRLTEDDVILRIVSKPQVKAAEPMPSTARPIGRPRPVQVADRDATLAQLRGNVPGATWPIPNAPRTNDGIHTAAAADLWQAIRNVNEAVRTTAPIIETWEEEGL